MTDELLDIDRVPLEKFNTNFHKHKALLFNELRLKGITKLGVHFSGSGDSGNINESEPDGFFNEEVKYEDMLLSTPLVTERAIGRTFDVITGEWVTRTQPITMVRLQELSDGVTYDVLDASSIDWCNNDGGQGTITYIVGKTPEEDVIEADIGQNHTETTMYNFVA